MKMNRIKKFDIYSSENEDDILLQLKTWVVNIKKNSNEDKWWFWWNI